MEVFSLQSLLRSLLLACCCSGGSYAQPAIVIRNVTIVDTTGKPAVPAANVLIEGERIKAIGKGLSAPPDAVVIDGTDRYLIPGLWDMHVHALWTHDNPDRMFPLFLANGVTGIRDLGSPLPLEELQSMRAKFDSSRTAPRLVLAYKLVDGNPPVWSGSLAASGAADARSAVRELNQAGTDAVKVYARLSRDSYFAVLKEASRSRIPVVGHVPITVSALEAARAGQHTIEHLSELLLSCSSRENELRAELISARTGVERNRIRARQLRQLVETYDEAKAADLIEEFRKRGTWQTPTLVANRAYAYPPESGFAAQPWARYMSAKTVEGYQSRLEGYRNSLTAGQREWHRRTYEKEAELVRRMHSRGVGFLVGTDAELFHAAGFAVHRELELLVASGLSPLQALQAATLNPAKCLRRLHDFGSVAPGRLADLVLLEADPLADIRNTRKIAAVILKGQLFTRKDLDQMLADVQTAAAPAK